MTNEELDKLVIETLQELEQKLGRPMLKLFIIRLYELIEE